MFHGCIIALALGSAAIAVPVGAQGAAAYLAASDSTRDVATAYVKAYVSLDWDALERMLGDSASFQDPTAELVFGGVIAQGKTAMMEKFRTGYAGLEMSFVQSRAIFTGHHAIVEGNLTWSAPVQGGGRVESANSPFVVIVKVVGGKVVEHRDYADYHPFIAAMRAGSGASPGM